MGDIRMEREQLVGFAGVILLVIGVFLPIVHVPIVGSLSYMANGWGDGWVVFIFAVIAGGLIAVRAYPWVAIPALLAMSVCINTLWHFSSLMVQLRESAERNLHDNPFAGLAQLAIASVGLEWGWVVLFLGILCLIITAGSSLIWGTEKPHSQADFIGSALKTPFVIAVISAVALFLALQFSGNLFSPLQEASGAMPAAGAQESTGVAPAAQSPARAQLNEAVTLTVTKKDYLPSDIQAERYHDSLQFEFDVKNHTSKDIAGVKGTLEFRDMFGTLIRSGTLSLDLLRK